MSRPRDLADGEREAFSHSRGSWNDDHLVRRGVPTWRATVDESYSAVYLGVYPR